MTDSVITQAESKPPLHPLSSYSATHINDNVSIQDDIVRELLEYVSA